MVSPRYLFGSGVSDFAIAPPSRHGGFVVSAASLGNGTLWSSETGGTQYTDLQTSGGGATTTIRTDTEGGLVPFYGPPGIDCGWVDFGGGSRAFLTASRGQDEHVAGLLGDATSATYTAVSGAANSAAAAKVASDTPALIDSRLGGDATNLVPVVAGKLDSSTASSTYETKTVVANKVAKGEIVFNAKDYGAKGDNITDDSTALGDAISAANIATAGGSGATVYLPPGTYLTNTGITLPTNVQLRGAGQRASRIKGIGAVTTLTIGTNCVVSDLQITGDATAGGKGLAATAASNHWSLVDCWVTGCETGVYLTNTYINTLTRVTIQSCTTGMRLTGANLNATYIMNGEIKGCVDGVWADTSAATNNTFYGCTIEGNSGYGFRQAGSPYAWSLRDCYFEANTAGHIYQTVQSRALVISGCSFAGAAAWSIKLDAGLDTLIEGNTFNLVGTVGPSIQCASQVQRTAVIKNWYAAGQEFVPATNYLGTLLTLIDREISFPPSTTTASGMNIPHGTAPTSPKNGDVWTTTAGIYVQVNGSTVGPLGPAAVAATLDFMSTLGDHPAAAMYGNASNTFTSANSAILVRFRPKRNITPTELHWICAAATSGNYDIGIYDFAGNRLWSLGSTAWPTANTTAVATVTGGPALVAGTDYYIAFAGDNTTGTWRGMTESAVDQVKLADGTYFSKVVAAAFPLPATISPGGTRAGKAPLVTLHG